MNCYGFFSLSDFCLVRADIAVFVNTCYFLCLTADGYGFFTDYIVFKDERTNCFYLVRFAADHNIVLTFGENERVNVFVIVRKIFLRYIDRQCLAFAFFQKCCLFKAAEQLCGSRLIPARWFNIDENRVLSGNIGVICNFCADAEYAAFK